MTANGREATRFGIASKRCARKLLGALLDAVSCALRRERSVQLERTPRMADFAHWVVAAETALPWNEGTFLAAYEDNRCQAIEASLENDLVASAVLRLVREERFVEGTCEELLARFEANGDTPTQLRSWPRSPRALSNHLARLAPALRQAGVVIGRRREPGTGRRLVRLEVTEAISDRHDRHDRHSRASLGLVPCDGRDGRVTEPPADRHGEEPVPGAIRDGCDGRDGLDAVDDSEALKL